MDDDYIVPIPLNNRPAANLKKSGWKSRLDSRQDFWELYAEDEEWGILTHGGVRIAHDGGVNGVGKLLYALQYFYAMVMVGFTIANVYTILKADVPVLFEKKDEESRTSKFLLSTWMLEKFTSLIGQPYPNLPLRNEEEIIMVGELSCLVLLMLRMLWYCFAVAVSPRCFKYHGVMMRWSYAARLLWDLFPQMASFSAMRLLYYVTPSVVGTEAYVVFYMVGHRLRESPNFTQFLTDIRPAFSYVASRAVFLVIGFDAFLVKLRMVTEYVDGEFLKYDGMIAIGIFLFQTLNVVNLNWFVRERLFIFIFGGQGGNLSDEEAARADVWNALIAKRIYMHFGFWRFLVIMLGFDDYDFQMLVLEVEEDVSFSKKRKAAKTYAASNDVDIFGKLENGFGDALDSGSKDR